MHEEPSASLSMAMSVASAHASPSTTRMLKATRSVGGVMALDGETTAKEARGQRAQPAPG